jgi:hypothetical protein
MILSEVPHARCGQNHGGDTTAVFAATADHAHIEIPQSEFQFCVSFTRFACELSVCNYCRLLTPLGEKTKEVNLPPSYVG